MRRAASFASPFGCAGWARLAGLWHDIGKLSPDFQRHIRISSGIDAHIEGKPGSVDQIVPLEHSITRMAVATEAEAEKQQGDNRTMGRKFTVPYALYRCHGFISASLAEQTNFSATDLELFWDARQHVRT